ncbi:hypothetical protein ADUPG1_008088, partial [Aduncisulcus paluster]
LPSLPSDIGGMFPPTLDQSQFSPHAGSCKKHASCTVNPFPMNHYTHALPNPTIDGPKPAIGHPHTYMAFSGPAMFHNPSPQVTYHPTASFEMLDKLTPPSCPYPDGISGYDGKLEASRSPSSHKEEESPSRSPLVPQFFPPTRSASVTSSLNGTLGISSSTHTSVFFSVLFVFCLILSEILSPWMWVLHGGKDIGGNSGPLLYSSSPSGSSGGPILNTFNADNVNISPMDHIRASGTGVGLTNTLMDQIDESIVSSSRGPHHTMKSYLESDSMSSHTVHTTNASSINNLSNTQIPKYLEHLVGVSNSDSPKSFSFPVERGFSTTFKSSCDCPNDASSAIRDNSTYFTYDESDAMWMHYPSDSLSGSDPAASGTMASSLSIPNSPNRQFGESSLSISIPFFPISSHLPSNSSCILQCTIPTPPLSHSSQLDNGSGPCTCDDEVCVCESIVGDRFIIRDQDQVVSVPLTIG